MGTGGRNIYVSCAILYLWVTKPKLDTQTSAWQQHEYNNESRSCEGVGGFIFYYCGLIYFFREKCSRGSDSNFRSIEWQRKFTNYL